MEFRGGYAKGCSMDFSSFKSGECIAIQLTTRRTDGDHPLSTESDEYQRGGRVDR